MISIGEDASKVLDGAILVAGIWHVIEWIRSTVLITVVFIGAHQLMWFWYATIWNSLFGIVAFIIVHVAYFGDAGKGCETLQPTRYQWLMVEVIFFWCLFWFFQYPFIVLRCCNREKLHEVLNKKDDDDEEEDVKDPNAKKD